MNAAGSVMKATGCWTKDQAPLSASYFNARMVANRELLLYVSASENTQKV
jgi:hypothetical protein